MGTEEYIKYIIYLGIGWERWYGNCGSGCQQQIISPVVFVQIPSSLHYIILIILHKFTSNINEKVLCSVKNTT